MLAKTKSDGIQTEIITITPEIAAAWLEHNTRNRPASSRVVEKYARDMTAGNFKFTAEPIQWSSDKELLNGQHRLLASVKSGQPFMALVVYNIDPDAQDFMDGGKSRTAADILAMNGVNNAKAVAAVARLVLSEKFGRKSSNWSRSELTNVIDRHSYLQVSVRAVYGQNKRIPRHVYSSHLAFMHFIGGGILSKPERADAFVNVFATGIPDYENDPAHLFRERLIRSADQNTILKPEEALRGLKQAWNLFAREQPARVLRWTADIKIEGLSLDAL